jgi:hypothetical protein
MEYEKKDPKSVFRSDVLVKDLEHEDVWVQSVVTNAAAYLPEEWGSMCLVTKSRYNDGVARLHAAKVRIAESEPLVREVAEAILLGEEKAAREAARLDEVLAQATELAGQIRPLVEASKNKFPIFEDLSAPKGVDCGSMDEVLHSVYLPCLRRAKERSGTETHDESGEVAA